MLRVGAVANLLNLRGPSAVRRRVSLVYVSPVQAELGIIPMLPRPCIKCVEILCPFIAYSYAATSIFRVVFARRLLATTLHSAPYIVQPCVRPSATALGGVSLATYTRRFRCAGKRPEERIAVIDRSIVVAKIAVLRRKRLIVIFSVKHLIRVTSGLIPHDDRRHHAK